MKSSRFVTWLQDHVLNRRDVKYVLVPLVQNGPLAVTALWIALGHPRFWADPKGKFDGYNSAWLVLFATALGGLISAGHSTLTDQRTETISGLLAEQRQLLRLVGYVRVIVTAKSRRFAEALKRLPPRIEPGTAFLTITRPDEQIKEIVRNAYDYFRNSVETQPDEAIAVSLMCWNDNERHLDFMECFPHESRPKTSPTEFGDTSTIAGRAFHGREMVISSDISIDSRYKRLSDQPNGSMFSYPIWDEFTLKVAGVINVVSSEVQRFQEEDRGALDIPMRVFGERLLLELRLVELRGRTERANGGIAHG